MFHHVETFLRSRKGSRLVNTVVKVLCIMEELVIFVLNSRVHIKVCGLQPIMEMKKTKLLLGLSQLSSFILQTVSHEGFVAMLNLKP